MGVASLALLWTAWLLLEAEDIGVSASYECFRGFKPFTRKRPAYGRKEELAD